MSFQADKKVEFGDNALSRRSVKKGGIKDAKFDRKVKVKVND